MARQEITEFTRAKVRVQPSPLGKGRIISVVIQNTFNNMDNSANNSEIMIGSAIDQPHQLVPGEKSEEIYARDLEHVYARVRARLVDDEWVDGIPVDVTLIIKKEQEF